MFVGSNGLTAWFQPAVYRFGGVRGLFRRRWLENPIQLKSKEASTSAGNISVLQKTYENAVGLFPTPPEPT